MDRKPEITSRMKRHNFTIYLNVTAYQTWLVRKRERGESNAGHRSIGRNNYHFAIAVVEVWLQSDTTVQ